MSSPCHIELILAEKDSGVKAETVRPYNLEPAAAALHCGNLWEMSSTPSCLGLSLSKPVRSGWWPPPDIPPWGVAWVRQGRLSYISLCPVHGSVQGVTCSPAMLAWPSARMAVVRGSRLRCGVRSSC
jgi:hypothetical protein